MLRFIVIILFLGLLAGCGTTVQSSNQFGVVTDSSVPNASESQRLADIECAKYHRVAKMTSAGGLMQRQFIFDCVNDDNQSNDLSSKGTGDMYKELMKLKELLDSKVITQDEYDAQKKRILNKYK